MPFHQNRGALVQPTKRAVYRGDTVGSEDDLSAIRQHWSAPPCVNALDKTVMRKAPADSPKNIDCSQHI